MACLLDTLLLFFFEIETCALTPLIGVHIAVILIFILKSLENLFNDRKDKGKKNCQDSD